MRDLKKQGTKQRKKKNNNNNLNNLPLCYLIN